MWSVSPRRLWAALVLLAALAALLPERTPVAHASAFPYYPYPCPVPSGGRDFNGNGQEAVTPIFSPTTGAWSLLGEGGGATTWGVFGDVPTPGDYNGDGASDLAVWRPSNGTWYVRCSTTAGCASGSKTVTWGAKGDLPVAADYDADGTTDFAVWRPSNGTWYVLSGQTLAPIGSPQVWGQYGDCPIPSRLASAGPGPLELNLFRPSTGTWFLGRSVIGTGGTTVAFGTWGDIPFSVDLDGNGDGDLVVWRPATGVWFGLSPAIQIAWGRAGDIPLVRSGGAQPPLLTVWRPSNQVFYNCFNPSGAACGVTNVEGPTGTPGSAVVLSGRAR